MKAVVETVLNSPVPQITLKPETAADEAVLDAILNRNGAASSPDCGYAIVSFERNGTSFQKLTFGLANCTAIIEPPQNCTQLYVECGYWEINYSI